MKQEKMKHIHLFQKTGGGCGVGKYCDDSYECECGARFKALSKVAIHFQMPQFIAGKDKPQVVSITRKKLSDKEKEK